MVQWERLPGSAYCVNVDVAKWLVIIWVGNEFDTTFSRMVQQKILNFPFTRYIIFNAWSQPAIGEFMVDFLFCCPRKNGSDSSDCCPIWLIHIQHQAIAIGYSDGHPLILDGSGV